jgi:Beta-propeller repeat
MLRSRITRTSWNVISFTYVAIAMLAACTMPAQRNSESTGVLLNAPEANSSSIDETVALAAKQRAQASARLAGTRIPFIENNGHGDPNVKFSATTFGGTVFVTRDGELVYSLPEKSTSARGTNSSASQRTRGIVLTEELVDGNVTEILGETRAPTRVSVFRGNDQAKWRTAIATYETLILGEVYPGVTARLSAHGHTVEKLFYVQPAAAPEQIRLRMQGGQRLATTHRGELEVTTELGPVRFSQPIAYQQIDGERRFIDVAYTLEGDTYGFALGEYDRKKELVIDPILATTFAGGTQDDIVEAIALDTSGNVHATGYTNSSDYPGASTGLVDSTFAGGQEAFVLKLDASLSTILAATFLGGSSGETGRGIAVDKRGSIYVAGDTSSTDFPIGRGYPADPTQQGLEGFIVKLDADLSTMLASTFVGGNGSDWLVSLALNGLGDVYVAGTTGSSTTCSFPFISTTAVDQTCAKNEGYVARLDADLRKIRATFVGGSENDELVELAVDSVNNVYVLGSTSSPDVPGVTALAADPTPGPAPALDGFVARLDPALTTLSTTYLAGSGADRMRALAVSGSNVFVSGVADRYQSIVLDFPGVDPATVSTGGNELAFVTRFDTNLRTVQTTMFRQVLNNSRQALAPDGAGNIYFAAQAFGTMPAVGPDSADPTNNYGGYIALLDGAQLTFLKATYLGGSIVGAPQAIDFPVAFAADSAGSVYVAGHAESQDFPGVTPWSADPTVARPAYGIGDGFVTRLGSCDLVAQVWGGVMEGGPLEACHLTRVRLFDREILAGCSYFGCCPHCATATPLDWRIFVRGPGIRSIVLRFEVLDARATKRLEIEGPAQWLSENQLLVHADGQIMLRGLQYPESSEKPFRAMVERMTFEQPELFDGSATIDVIQSVDDETIAETILKFVGGAGEQSKR